MMPERRKLVEMWQRGDAAALATLVRVEGSSYRKVGARMMVATNGDYIGSISGGCLEAEVVRKLTWLVRDGACVHRYSTLFDDTADIPYGLGCGGTVDLLLEPAGTPEFELLMDALRRSLEGETIDVLTRLPEKGRSLTRVVDTGLIAAADQEANEVFVERIEPPQRLLVIGAGDDAQPLVSMAALLGWRVHVADGRPQWAKAHRFPDAERVLAPDDPNANDLAMQRSDVAVIMTHSYEQDREWLKRLLPARPRYLGLLGARHRSALLASEVADMLGWPLEQVCDQLFAPVGLDLGGDGAEAIALAVLAEMQACVEGKLVQSRRMTTHTVEEQVTLGGASRYLQSECAM